MPTDKAEGFLKEINDYIKKNRGTFALDTSRIISDYRGERGLMRAYDDRQLLEILQNADDAGAKKVAIELDTKNKTFSISNTGKSFSAMGIGSLMMRDLSTKQGQRKMIGNKGLGFRSLLNWAQRINIFTCGYCITFSDATAAFEFEPAVPNTSERESLLKKYKYKSGITTFPFLGIPRIISSTTDPKWATVIKVHYKPGSENAIKKQLEIFKKEILIFLDNIEQLEITISGKTNLC
jgi:hypothetical protein